MEVFTSRTLVYFLYLLAVAVSLGDHVDRRDQTYRTVWRRSTATSPYGSRPGNPTETNSCQYVREVPEDLRDKSQMAPDGLDSFYQKYTEAYGIPVLSSEKVPDDALRRACYMVRYLLAGHSKVREAYYHSFGRVAVLSKTETTADMPGTQKAKHLEWTRGIGADIDFPMSAGAEENILCYPPSDDQNFREDTFFHDIIHGVDRLGASVGIPDFQDAVWHAYTHAKKTGLWDQTFAMDSEYEYLAEAVQSYFGVNEYQGTPDGIHGPIKNRKMLQAYDLQVYLLIRQVFPCDNKYIRRCATSRAYEDAQELKMNCNENGETDSDVHCATWALEGECENNPGYMWKGCPVSCAHVTASTSPGM